MDPRFSAKVYPRKDNIFQHKKSLDFDSIRSKIFVERTKDKYDIIMEWVAFIIIGALTGLTAAIMSDIEEKITEFRRNQADDIIGDDPDNLVGGWLFFTGISVGFVLVACAMTIFWGPGANGSGVAELIGYFNGINYPNVIGFETFVTKVFGVVLAVVGGLCVGKEGPLAHIGANIGAVVVYLPLPRFDWFRNDTYKRNMMAAGCSAGVSAAFGAPVGGALFAFEISKPNVFWKFSVIWKVFLSCALSVFTLAMVSSFMKGETIHTINSSVLKFGVDDIAPPTFMAIPGAIAVGVITGLLGGFFVLVNSNLGLVRKKYIKENWQKLAEAAFFSFATTSVFYWMPSLVDDCEDASLVSLSDNADLIVAYSCPKGFYSPMGTMLMNTEGDAIRTIISGFEGPNGVNSTNWHLFIFAMTWYFFTIVTYGVWVPAGLFLPGIIIGCAIGGCWAEIQAWITGTSVAESFTPDATGYKTDLAVTNVLVGAGAMLSAYCRLTYSLVVIMLETTSSINIFLPMMTGIMVARAVGNLLTNSLYDRALRMKQMPFLRSDPPAQTKSLQAHVVMSKELVTLPSIANMESCKKALQSHHNAYPVINTAGRLVGVIPKHMVVKILQKKAFYDQSSADRSQMQDRTEVSDQFGVNGESSEPLIREEKPSNTYISDGTGTAEEFYLDYDEKHGFPATQPKAVVPWTEFCADIHSNEADGEKVILDVIEENYEEWIDLRPYMIESPLTVSLHDKFYKILDQFRLNHARHICVIDPSNGAIKGVITRKDLFAYNCL